MLEGLISVFGKLKSLVSVTAGGQRQNAGGDAYQAGGNINITHAPPAPPRPPWHLRDGAPDVSLSLAVNHTTRIIDGSDLLFSTAVHEVEIRSSGFAGADQDWHSLGHAATARAGMAFHAGSYSFPTDNEAIVEIEARFWWGDEERSALFRRAAGEVIAGNTFGQPTYS